MNYQTKNVFQNKFANQTIDLIYYQIDEFAKSNSITLNLSEDFGLTGKAAAVLQDSEFDDLKQIVFAVSDSAIYKIITNELPKLITYKGVVKFKERTIFYFDDFIIEFWLMETLNIIDVDTIKVQLIEEIPPILL